LEVENILPILNQIAILGGLNEKQLFVIFRLLESETYGAGEVVFEQGDSPTHIRLVSKGRVRIVKDLHGTPLELYEFRVGDCFEET